MADAIPKNATARMAHRVRGNPPTAHLESSVSNYFPGLEFDLRGLWGKVFDGIVLHETQNLVIRVEPGAPAAMHGQENALLLEARTSDGVTIALSYPGGSRAGSVDRGNALAELMRRGGETVTCRFLPRPYKVTHSSTLDRDGLAGVEAHDMSGRSFWASQARDETSLPSGEPMEFLQWDYGEGEVHPLKSLRILVEHRLAGFNPVRYRFRSSLTGNDDDWEDLAAHDELSPDREMPGWRRMDLEASRPVRFVRMEIFELSPESINPDGEPVQFAAVVAEVQFDEFEDAFEVPLRVRTFFSGTDADSDPSPQPEAVKPGELTQSLCSPWQHDYRDCVCFYWASSRPDFVNVDENGNGHNWTDLERPVSEDGTPQFMFFNRTTGERMPPETPPSGARGTIGISYKTLFETWESQPSGDEDEGRDKGALRFQIDGKDES